MKAQDIDRHLQRWADGYRVDNERLEDLEGQIRGRANRQGTATDVWSRLGLYIAASLAGAAAASAIIAVLGIGLNKDLSHFSSAAISADAGRHTARVMSRLQAEFPDGIHSVVWSKGGLRIETGTEPSQKPIDSSCVSFRLTLVERGVGQAWQVREFVELVAASNAVVTLETGGEDRTRADLWAHLLPDGLILVEGRATMAAPVELEVTVSRVIEAGQPAPLLTVGVGGGRELGLVVAVRPLEIQPPTGPLA